MTVEELFDHFDYWDIFVSYVDKTADKCNNVLFEDYEDFLIFLKRYGDYNVLYWSVSVGGHDFEITIEKE